MIPTIKQFVAEYIDSLVQLEIFFLLQKFPEREWTPSTVSNELRSNITIASKILYTLYSLGLLEIVTQPETYRITSKFKGMMSTISQIHDFYTERPTLILSLIYEKSTDKLKGFSDAFKIKKD